MGEPIVSLLPRYGGFLAAMLALRAQAWAQFTDKVTTTPVILQDGFGPAGNLLPFGGQEYCSPTAASMSVAYLGVNGFNQLAPANPTAADELNLDRVMAGLMSTGATTGTSTSAITSAIATYLNAKGISSSNYTLTTLNSPTIAQLATLNQSGTVVNLVCGYYSPSGSTYVREGGHCVALLNQGVTASGQTSPSTLVVNNPLPCALEPAADNSSSSLQSLNTVAATGSLTSFGSLVLDPSQFSGFWGTTRTVVETALALKVNTGQQSINNPTPAAWVWTSNQTLNPNGGNLTVLAPIQSAGACGLSITSAGVVELENNNGSSGANSIAMGTLRSDIASGTPFGSGSISLAAGTLQLTPVAGSATISLTAANSLASQVTYSSGCEIQLNRNGNSSLSLAIGGYTDGSSANLARSGYGTLLIAPASGTANLGASEQLIVNGSGGNLPVLTNGIVNPSVVSQDNDANGSGDFLTYGSGGFARAAYTQASVTPITSTTASTVYDAEVSQTVPSSTTASVYAVKVGPAAITGGASSTLNVGPQTTGQAGVILNGGTISTANLNFGPAEGLIFTSVGTGTISSTIQGSGGLTTFGAGVLVLSGANTFSGGIRVNSGTLNAANNSGSISGGGPVTVNANATLELSGPNGCAGGAGGGNIINSGGTVLLNGGILAGTSTFNAGSNLLGSGSIAGAITFSGTIGGSATDFGAAPYAGVENISFGGNVTMNGSTIYDWRLNALDATPADAGSAWSLLKFTPGTTVHMGSSGNYINVTLDLASGLSDPNSGSSFWSTSHQWEVAYDSAGFNSIWYRWSFPRYAQGYFTLTSDSGYDTLYVDYTASAVPEPGASCVFAAAALFALAARPKHRVQRFVAPAKLQL